MRRLGLVALVLGSLVCPEKLALAQNAKPRVTFDFDTGAFSHEMPHGKPFFIDVVLPRDHRGTEGGGAHLWRIEEGKACGAINEDRRINLRPRGRERLNDGRHKETYEAPSLRFASPYCFKFTAVRSVTDAETAKIKRALDALLERSVTEGGLSDEDQVVRFLISHLGELGEAVDISKDLTVAQIIADWITSSERTFTEASNYAEAMRSIHVSFDDAVDDVVELSLLDAVQVTFPKNVPPDITALVDLHNQIVKKLKAVPATDRRSIVARPDAVASKPKERTDVIEAISRLNDSVGSVRAAHCSELKPPKIVAKLRDEKDSLASQVAAFEEKKARDGGVLTPDDTERLNRLQQQLASKTANYQKELGRHAVFCNRIRAIEENAARAAEYVEHLRQLGTRLVDKLRQFDRVVKDYLGDFRVARSADERSTAPTYTERAGWYISGDVGLVLPIFPNGETDLALFVGANVYFVPVDKSVPLSVDGGFLKRFSLVGGFTVTKIQDTAKTVEGILGSNLSVLFGAGLRVTDYIRVGGGTVIFRQKDPNPTVDRSLVRLTPYVSLSIDIDVAGTVQGLFTQGSKVVGGSNAN